MDTDRILQQIAAEHGTPTYAYDLDAVLERLHELQAALPDAGIRYAVKANPSAAVLRTLGAAGAGAEAITRGELARARAAGISPDSIVLGGPAQGAGLRRDALDAGVAMVSLDSTSQWEDWEADLEAGTGRPRFLVRVNPALDPRTHAHLATGSADSKFGQSPSDALDLAKRVHAAGLFAGYHVHAGSQIGDMQVFRGVLDALAPLYDELPGEWLDIGGGYRVPDFPLEEYASLISDFCRRRGLRVIIEPGRFLTATAGVLLTRVLHVKKGPVNHVIMDAGMADLIRPALYGAGHPFRQLDPGGAQMTADLDGPLCENADRLARDVTLQEPAKGDLFAVELAGAYGHTMASNYASSLRPAEVVISGGEARLVRRRETPADLLAAEI